MGCGKEKNRRIMIHQKRKEKEYLAQTQEHIVLSHEGGERKVGRSSDGVVGKKTLLIGVKDYYRNSS